MIAERKAKWPMFRRVWRRAEMLERVASLLGVNLAVGARLDAGEAIGEATTRCLHCRFAGECRSWMEASECSPLPPGLCPNRKFFSRCKEKQDSPNLAPSVRAGE